MKKNVRKTISELDRFLEFVYDSPESSLFDDRRDLEACGVNVERIEARVAELVEETARAARLGWIERARDKQARFEERLRLKREELGRRFGDTKSLVQAMLGGELGPTVQAQAGVFFRNRKTDSVTENDLVSFIEDCKLLEDEPEDEGGK